MLCMARRWLVRGRFGEEGGGLGVVHFATLRGLLLPVKVVDPGFGL